MTITLFKADGVWMAHYSGPGREDITNLFGTDTLPTAFTEKAHPYKVFAEIERLNPTHEIVIR